MDQPVDTEELQADVATACRILALKGLMTGITGHVSARGPADNEMLLRCRPADERGVANTEPRTVRRMRHDGTGSVGEGYELPLEHRIHGAVYAARPDIGAVVHAHPPYCVLCSLAEVELVPVYGAFDPVAIALTADRVPIYESSCLVTDDRDASALIATLGSHPCCLMRGHGITVTGTTVQEATIRAVSLERLAWFCWHLSSGGDRQPPVLRQDDLDRFVDDTRPRLALGTQWTWNAYKAVLQ